MKLVWHIFRKDLRRMALLLVLIVCVMLARFVIGWRMEAGDRGDLEWISWLRFSVDFLAYIEIALTYFCTALLVGEDRTVGTQAFWQTRPIAGARLLAAKVLGVVMMFGVLPVVVLLPWWLAHGYGVAEIAEAAAQELVLQAAIVVVPFMLGALTDGMSRVVLWTVVPALVVLLWMGNMAATTSTSLSVFGTRESLIWTRTIVSLAFVVLGVSAAIVVQYLTRRTARSVLLGGGGFAAAVLTGTIWPWDWATTLRREPEPRSMHEVLEQVLDGSSHRPPVHPTVRFELAKATVSSKGQGGPTFGETNWLEVRGVPSDRALVGGSVQQRWSWLDGAAIERSGLGLFDVGFGLAFVRGDAHPVMRQALGLAPGKLPAAQTGSVSTELPRSFEARMKKLPAAYEAQFDFYLARPVVLLESPLHEGPWLKNGSLRARVLRVDRAERGMSLTLLATMPAPARLDSLLMRLRLIHRVGDIVPLLVNRQGEGRMAPVGGQAEIVMIGTVAIVRFSSAHLAPPRADSPTQPADPFAGTTLVWVELRDFERAGGQMKISNFLLTEKDR